jgi:D-sedoheptulose 7-phosphate isomerase
MQMAQFDVSNRSQRPVHRGTPRDKPRRTAQGSKMAARTTKSREESIAEHFQRSRETLDRAAGDRGMLEAMIGTVDAMTSALRNGSKILIAGNGGSAADAQHIAGEFLSRLNFDRNPLPVIALTTDTSVLTAIGNDYGFERVFERQIRGLARQGDVVLAISTSGRSPNILAGLRAAREAGATTIGFTGNAKSTMVALCDICVRVPSASTPQIQQIHIVAAHAICGLVERELFGPPA